MSYRERQTRKEMAAEASARFGELMELLEKRARIQVCRPAMLRQLREGGCDFAADMRGQWPEVWITYLQEGGAPAEVLAAAAADYDAQEAGLAARIAEFVPDAAVMALMAAELAVDQGDRSL